jgi:uncharacterized protein (TIGR02246 family)
LLSLSAAFVISGSALAAPTSDRTQDESAIRAQVVSYVNAYNRGDAKAVAAHWSDSGQWQSPAGDLVEGRPAIEKQMQALFAAKSGAKIEVVDPKIRFVTSDVAIEEGTAHVLASGEPPSTSTYLAVHVKKNGKWLLDSVHETEVPAPSASAAYEQLTDLEWMVGNWVDEGSEGSAQTTCRWSKNKSFLLRTFKVATPGGDFEGTQVVGWDPVARSIRSWVFDSEGGFSQGAWVRRGDSWVVKSQGYLADGRQASSINTFTYVDENSFAWKALGREVEGESLPDIAEIKVIRQQDPSETN